MEFTKEFEFAKDTIKEAGEIIQSLLSEDLHTSLKKDASVLTIADKQSEEYIRERFMQAFPGYGFIGEESKPVEKEISWIIDPVDGTIAYSRNIPEYGIAIALKKGNDVIFSVQYLPTTKRLLHAYKGKGAYENSARIFVSSKKIIKESLFSIGMQNLWRDAYQGHTLSLLKNNNRFRVGHSAVVESYYLASGKTDILLRFDQALWDTAAETLLMKEAGAIVTDDYGNPLELDFSSDKVYNYAATNKWLYKNCSELLYRKK